MSNKFITNQKRLLSEVMNNILPSSANLYFLVGYFYFSGFEEIYKNIGDKEVKILVGLDVEKDMLNNIKEIETLKESNLSRSEIRERYNKMLVSIFNDTGYFDSAEKQDAFRIFLSKIDNGTLEIRKTKEPNHAKMYLFENKKEHNQEGEYPGTVITGSSNLTRAGLKGRYEINVVFRDEHFDEGYKLFKELWDNAIPIADVNTKDEFFKQVIQKIWIDKLPKPFLLFVRVLVEYFSFNSDIDIKLPSEVTDNKYIDLKYQIDAIRQSIDILNKHTGVIIADVVGMGKSIIASAVAHNMGMKTIVIAPPHLKEQWEDFRFDFDFNARVYSSGSIKNALKDNLGENKGLIIIDEAHKYRNEGTIDYGHLHQLCQGRKVMLLSATPFNNKPQDIFSMISLFQVPSKTTIQTIDNLSYQFRELAKEYNAIKKLQKSGKEDVRKEIDALAIKIRDILSPVVIRRSRIDLDEIKEYKKDIEKQNISFPEVAPPEPLEYNLGKLSGLYKDTLEEIAPDDEKKGFIGARYKPTSYMESKKIDKYIKQFSEIHGDENLFKQAQVNVAKFMRRLLVRRFESSIYAFRQTLDSMIVSSEYIRDWYYKLGKVPIYKKGKLPDIEDLLEQTGEDLDEELKDINFNDMLSKHIQKGLLIIDKNDIKEEFIAHVNKDIKLLKEIRSKWLAKEIKNDPKADTLKEILEQRINSEPDRKIIIFTEFADTANYLYDKLKNGLRIFKYTSADSNKTNKETIKVNFDAGYKKQKNDYDILIATDSISEGYNLHRAGIVFNYDIPYNPTRIIQRVGRINRINKKVFDKLFIYNYFPTATGEKETGIKKIVTLKLFLIHALLGEDTKVLTSDEELKSYYKEEYEKAVLAQEILSWDVKYRNILDDIRSSKKDYIEQATDIPKRVRIKRTAKKKKNGIIIFARKGEEYSFMLGNAQQDGINISPELAMELFEAEMTEKPEKVSKSFENIYQKIRETLFKKKTQVVYEKGKTDAINKLEVLKEKLTKYKDYIEDLQYVIDKLDSLPERYLKQIRAISEKFLECDLKELMEDVPQQYLNNIREKARNIEEEDESLIFSEELI